MTADGVDELLLARVARGDEEALERVYEACVDGLYGFVFYRVGRDAALAEEVVQQTFVDALDAWGKFDPARGSVLAWLCSRSRNVIRAQLRARKRAAELARWEQVDATLAQVFQAIDREPLSDEVIEREETRHVVNMTCAHLPERYSEILRAKYVSGESLEQLAARLDISEAAAKSLLARARRAFREAFATLSRQTVEAQ